jgi:serine/threonine protein kinase
LSGRYEIERPLGHGAMGVVDLARDVELGRHVALKRLAENLSRDPDLRARFLREGRIAARLSHANVVKVFDVGELDGQPYIAMEHVDGESLADLLQHRVRLPAAEVAQLGAQAARALAAAHASGLVHRDVKPHNLLLRRDGVLKLGDFGIAVGLEGTRLTMAGTVLGTEAYLSPEQARGEEVTSAADVYALGLVLVELLTGAPDRLPSLAGVPRPLADAIHACLERDPRRRPAAADLARMLAPDRATATAATKVLAPARGRSRTWLLLAAVSLALIAAGIAAAVVTTRGSHHTAPPPAKPARIAPVPHASTARQQALDLASWLQRYSG